MLIDSSCYSWVSFIFIFFFSSRRRHTRFDCDWSSDVCSSDLEMVVLSDHGQVDTIPFATAAGRAFGDVIAGLLPGFRVQEMKGKAYGASEKEARGHVHVTLSGGLSHVYFAEHQTRMDYAEVGSRHPELAPGISSLQEVGLVMARRAGEDVFLRSGRELQGNAVDAVLEAYGEPEVLRQQLSRLHSLP